MLAMIQSLELLSFGGGIPIAVCTVTCTAIVTILYSSLSTYRKLSKIPTMGSSSWLGSYWAALKFRSNANKLVQEGYNRYKPEGSPFKLAGDYRWLVFVSSRQHIEEIRNAPDEVLSFADTLTDLAYTLGWEMVYNPYHRIVVGGQVTRHLGNVYPEVRNEIIVAFDELLGLRGNEWKAVPVMNTVRNVVCRLSNRVFFPPPLCHDPDWLDISLRSVLDVIVAIHKFDHFPRFVAPFVVRFMSDVPKTKNRAVKYLSPMIEERLKLFEEHGNDWNDKPNDLLSWLLEEAPEAERTVRLLTERVLTVIFGAIHTSTHAFTNILFYLAEHPQYMQPLREEVKDVIEKEGWSKVSLVKMRKVDSFIKECQRLSGFSLFGVPRVALKDFTFLDGTLIPKGTFVAAASGSLHRDGQHYENPLEFNPFRFADIRDEDGEGTKHQFATTSSEYLIFGHGKHACPGRFFVSSEFKSMLAHIVMTYDVKLKDNGSHPGGIHDGIFVASNPSASVMFKRRTY